MTDKENELIRKFIEIVLEERIDIDELCKYSKEEIINMLTIPVYFDQDTTLVDYMEVKQNDVFIETREPCEIKLDYESDSRKGFSFKIRELTIEELDSNE